MRKFSRQVFKLIGAILLIGGIITIVYAIFFVQNLDYTVEIARMDSEPEYVRGETPFQRLLILFIGAVMIFIGYRSYNYIPYSERDKETVSEMDILD